MVYRFVEFGLNHQRYNIFDDRWVYSKEFTYDDNKNQSLKIHFWK